MKKIDIENVGIKNEGEIDDFMRGVLSMEFIKVGDKYLLKGSNSVIVDEAEKLKLERNEIIADNGDCGCEVDKIKKVSKINKKIREATKEVANDTIEETNSTL